MLIFGVRTRFAALASWFMLVSVQTRNPVILQGGDVYLRLLAFIAIFLPIGADGLAPEMFGPPAPAMLAAIRRRRPVVTAPPPRVIEARGPFAALAALKR